MAHPIGLEPMTHSLEGCCSIQLSYGCRMAAPLGLEPRTHGLTVRCSNQLSYTGIKFVNEYTTLFKNEKSNFIFLFNFMI